MKQCLLLAAFLSLLTLGLAAPAATQAHSFNIRDFGAVGDGRTVETKSINQTIEAAAAAGGGTVYVPPGRYLSASIHLQSNITLYLEAGSVIEAVDEKIAAYDLPEENEWGDKFHYQDFGHSHWKNSLIWGIGLENVSIVGPGLIHGKGLNPGFDRFAAPSTDGKDSRYKDVGPGGANKAIALRDCHNVTFRDFSILHGGHFGILATGVNNLTIDNLKIDTNRDGMDIDACQNVRVTNCSVNSPWDDGICLKASYGLGKIQHCDNITISNCYLAGNFNEGTLIDGTFQRSAPDYKSYQTGRIKLGTESNGDFKNITITNCVFDQCRGLAIESVDGSHIEDLAISNLTMRHVTSSPIFIRLGNRARGPNHPPVGTIRRVSINNVVSYDAGTEVGNVISGIPGHPIEDLQLSNVRFVQQGGGPAELGERRPPEEEAAYPEPTMFGATPGYAFFFRHVTGLQMHHAKLDFVNPEARPAIVLDDVNDAWFDHLNVQRGTESAPAFDLRKVTDFNVTDSRGILDTRVEKQVERKKL